MNVAELLSQFRDVLPLKIELALQFAAPLELKVELLAHLGELVVHDRQDVGA